MKKLNVYLTQYTRYSPEYNDYFIFAGPTILAENVDEAKGIILNHFSIAFTDYHIVNA